MKKLLYIHGYNGSANGHSFQLFSKHMPNSWQVIGMDYYQDDCQRAIQQIRETIKEQQIDLVVGSSLGGFLTLLITGVERIVINPCYLPSVELPKLEAIDELPTPQPEMIKTYAAFENVLKTFDEKERNLITGYFAPEDELLGDRYHETFRSDVHDFKFIPGGHHVIEEAVVQICNDIMMKFVPDGLPIHDGQVDLPEPTVYGPPSPTNGSRYLQFHLDSCYMTGYGPPAGFESRFSQSSEPIGCVYGPPPAPPMLKTDSQKEDDSSGIICPCCGSRVAASKFCPECGSKLS